MARADRHTIMIATVTARVSSSAAGPPSPTVGSDSVGVRRTLGLRGSGHQADSTMTAGHGGDGGPPAAGRGRHGPGPTAGPGPGGRRRPGKRRPADSAIRQAEAAASSIGLVTLRLSLQGQGQVGAGAEVSQFSQATVTRRDCADVSEVTSQSGRRPGLPADNTDLYPTKKSQKCATSQGNYLHRMTQKKTS